jgi:hypothetical protein
MTKPFMVVGVFLVGCAVGGVSSQLAVPKASAQQAATLTKWEHHCDRAGGFDEFSTQMQAAGAEGWELVSFANSGSFYASCFKRPKM